MDRDQQDDWNRQVALWALLMAMISAYADLVAILQG